MDQLQKERVKQQIEQMTSSVKTLSEQEIKTYTDQLVRDQMERETTYEKRENLLARRGYKVSDQLSEHINGAAINTQIEQEPENREQKKRNRKIRRQVRAVQKEVRADELGQRKALEADEKYSFIHTEWFATEYQYEILGNAKKWMLENPEAYAQNQETVDAMYKDLYIADEAYGAMSREARYYSFMETKDPAMKQEVNRRILLLADRQKFLQDRLMTLSDGLKALLQGREVSDQVTETLQEYKDIGLTEHQEQDRRRRELGLDNIRTAGGRHARRIAALNGYLAGKIGAENVAKFALTSDAYRGQVFIREETSEENKKWNKDVADMIYLRDLAKTKGKSGESLTEDESQRLQTHARSVLSDAFHDLREEMGDDPIGYVERYWSSDELLMQDMEKLNKLGSRLQQASDIGKIDVGGKTVQAEYAETYQLNEEKLRAMSLMFQQLGARARWLSYIYVYQTGTLTPEMLVGGDSNGIIKKDLKGNITDTTDFEKNLLEKVEKQFASADMQMKVWMNRYRAADAALNAQT